MTERTYEAVAVYWTEWKRSSRPRTDAAEAERLAIMKNIFLAVAEHPHGPVNEDAFEFVKSELPRWRAALGAQGESVRLFRGLVDKDAIDARTVGYVLPIGVPISFALSDESALGFAGRGHIDGVVISAAIPVENIVFSDAEGYWREGNAHREAEIVVVLSAPLEIQILEQRVPARVPLLSTREAKRVWNEDVQHLCSLEQTLMECSSIEVQEKFV